MRLAVVGRRIARRWWSTTNDGNHTFAGRWSATTNDGHPTLAGWWCGGGSAVETAGSCNETGRRRLVGGGGS